MLKEKDYGMQQTRESASVCRIEPANSWMWRLHTAINPGVCVTAGLWGEVAGSCAIPLLRQRVLAISYRRFDPSVRNYHYSLRNDPEERSSHSWPILEMMVLSAGSEKNGSTRESNSFHNRNRGLHVTLWKTHCHVLKDYNKRGSVRVKLHYRFPRLIISYLW